MKKMVNGVVLDMTQAEIDERNAEVSDALMVIPNETIKSKLSELDVFLPRSAEAFYILNPTVDAFLFEKATEKQELRSQLS